MADEDAVLEGSEIPTIWHVSVVSIPEMSVLNVVETIDVGSDSFIRTIAVLLTLTTSGIVARHDGITELFKQCKK